MVIRDTDVETNLQAKHAVADLEPSVIVSETNTAGMGWRKPLVAFACLGLVGGGVWAIAGQRETNDAALIDDSLVSDDEESSASSGDRSRSQVFAPSEQEGYEITKRYEAFSEFSDFNLDRGVLSDVFVTNGDESSPLILAVGSDFAATARGYESVGTTKGEGYFGFYSYERAPGGWWIQFQDAESGSFDVFTVPSDWDPERIALLASVDGEVREVEVRGGKPGLLVLPDEFSTRGAELVWNEAPGLIGALRYNPEVTQSTEIDRLTSTAERLDLRAPDTLTVDSSVNERQPSEPFEPIAGGQYLATWDHEGGHETPASLRVEAAGHRMLMTHGIGGAGADIYFETDSGAICLWPTLLGSIAACVQPDPTGAPLLVFAPSIFDDQQGGERSFLMIGAFDGWTYVNGSETNDLPTGVYYPTPGLSIHRLSVVDYVPGAAVLLDSFDGSDLSVDGKAIELAIP